MKIGIECGSSFWKKRSWQPVFRKLRIGHGFAVGPIMVWWESQDDRLKRVFNQVLDERQNEERMRRYAYHDVVLTNMIYGNDLGFSKHPEDVKKKGL